MLVKARSVTGRIGVLVLAGLALCRAAAAADNEPLRALADRDNFRIGTAVAISPFWADQTYRATLARQFNIIVAENAFKWSQIHPVPDSYSFGKADDLVDFARANGMMIRGHTLIWHNQLADWVSSGSYDREAAIALMRDHIRTVVGRYEGRVTAWDVVNEALDDSGALRADSFWYRTIGPDYIALALEFAHEADPAAKLYYNDYGAEGMNPKSDAVYALVRDLKAEGVPIDGVGWQMHVVNGFRIGREHAENAERLAALGLELTITELDVRIRLPATEAALDRQAETYGDIGAFCLAQANCAALLTWGFTDRYSWIPGFFAGYGDALIFDADYHPKPAYSALHAALEASRE